MDLYPANTAPIPHPSEYSATNILLRGALQFSNCDEEEAHEHCRNLLLALEHKQISPRPPVVACSGSSRGNGKGVAITTGGRGTN